MKNTVLQSIEDGFVKKEIPEFAPGDNVRVSVKIIEGSNQRIQNFEGVCIARRNAGVGSSFTVRKISHGEGVERVFPLHSPMVDSITVIRRGRVRRAKLYYLRGLRGKAARIVEKVSRKVTADIVPEKKSAPAPQTPQAETPPSAPEQS